MWINPESSKLSGGKYGKFRTERLDCSRLDGGFFVTHWFQRFGGSDLSGVRHQWPIFNLTSSKLSGGKYEKFRTERPDSSGLDGGYIATH
jgi:hypothetical protein